MKSSILRKMACLLLAFILALTATGCGSSDSGEVSDQLKYQPSDVNEELVRSYNQFALKLYSQLIEESTDNNNLFISPASIAAALAMTLNGADAETFTAMKQTLELQDLSLEEINQGNQVLLNLLQYGDPSVKVAIANSIWANEEKNFFLTLSRKTKIFTKLPCNRWISQKRKRQIRSTNGWRSKRKDISIKW